MLPLMTFDFSTVLHQMLNLSMQLLLAMCFCRSLFRAHSVSQPFNAPLRLLRQLMKTRRRGENVTVTVVTNRYHQRRAVACFRKAVERLGLLNRVIVSAARIPSTIAVVRQSVFTSC
eukprot:SAG31_NODE_8400_length_1458_cov_2.668138_3_plen_116_part_01